MGGAEAAGVIDMKCNAYRILIREGEADTLDPDEIELVEEHLHACKGCRAFQEGLRANADRLSDDVGAANDAVVTASQPGRSWGWVAAALIAITVTAGVLLVAGGKGWLHHPGGHGTGCARTAAWRHR